MGATAIGSYVVAALIMAFSVYTAMGDMKKHGDNESARPMVRLQVAVVALAILGMIGVVVLYGQLPHAQVSLIVLSIAVISFYISSSLHRKAAKKAANPPHNDL